MRKCLEDQGVTVLKTQGEHLDEMKHYIQTEAKSRTKEELLDAVKAIWTTVTYKYINHLRKVIPRVIKVQVEATGYGLILLIFIYICINILFRIRNFRNVWKLTKVVISCKCKIGNSII